MISVDEFVTLLRDELALPVTADDLDRGLDSVEAWDSVHLLALCTVLERETGRSLPFAEVLKAPNLAEVYRLATVS
jgi:aryl carrier-like protein